MIKRLPGALGCSGGRLYTGQRTRARRAAIRRIVDQANRRPSEII